MIDLKCIGHTTEYELNNIINLFSPYIQKNYTVESCFKQDQVITKLIGDVDKTILNEKTYKVVLQDNELQDKKWMRIFLKKALYEILKELTGKTMPWGTLTGIRPTKIVHDLYEDGYDEGQIRNMLKTYYCVSSKKIDLMMQVAHKEMHILDQNKPNEINIYIGIPFCPTRCVYCSFTAYSLEKKKDFVEPYLDALCKEISFIAEEKGNVPIRSLYIGGGTPTSLNEKQLERLLQHIAKCFNIPSIEEYTIEAGRPDTITPEKLRIMKAMGVNRISINPQSMNQKTLDAVGRKHTVEDIKKVYNEARKLGHDNINMDIILGLPGETPEDVAYTMQELTKLGPDNITVHTMAIKRASILKEHPEEYILTEGNNIEKMLELCEKSTKDAGLIPYYMYRQKNMLGNFENVGYAKPDKECVYNIEIMEEQQTIIAMGAGAITKIVHQNGERIDRVPNVKSLEDYISRINEMIERKKEGFIKFQ